MTVQPYAEGMDGPEGFDAVDADEAEETAMANYEDAALSVDAASVVQTQQSGDPSTAFGMNFSQQDIRMPRLRLAQALTPEVVAGDAKAGEWIDPNGKNHKELTVTVLGVRYNRARLVGPRGNQQIACRAGAPVGTPLIGVGDPGMACQQCPFSQWTEDEKGNRQPPECQDSYEYLTELEGGEVATVVMRRTAMPTARDLNTKLAQGGGRPTDITLTSSLESSNKNQFYVPVADIAE